MVWNSHWSFVIKWPEYWFVVVNSSGSTVGGVGTVYNDGPTTTQSFDWDTTTVPDGIYTIKLEARDKAGNKDPNEAPVLTDPEVLGDSVDWKDRKSVV